MSRSRLRLLILGGTSEASALARRLAGESWAAPILSLAGVTANPAPQPIPRRVGGFGGADGLAAYLIRERVAAVIDATHPFAARISANATTACRAAGVPLVVFTRLPWRPESRDRWIEVPTMVAAVEALGAKPKIVLLTQGRLQLEPFAHAPQHRYVIRAIDPPAGIDALLKYKLILARGPFSLTGELDLMRSERIEILVAKNSGGGATYPKIEAARALGISVVMVRRPAAPEAETLHDIDLVMAWIAAHRRSP